jgi:hypothetical protein
VKVDVTPAFAAYLAGNCGPTVSDADARERPEYGVAALFDGTVIELVLTFRSGSAYCCGEWQCHFMLFRTRRWDRLRQEFAALGLKVAGRLELQVDVVIEDGALFLTGNRLTSTLPRLVPVGASQYRDSVTEADYPVAEERKGE